MSRDGVGEILTVHVTTHPAEKDACIVTMLTKLMSMKTELEQLSEQERSHATDLLQQLQAVIIGARITESVLLFAHLMTSESLKSVHEMYESGRLNDIVRDLFRCLAKDEALSVEVEINGDSFSECEDGFAEDGKCAVHL